MTKTEIINYDPIGYTTDFKNIDSIEIIQNGTQFSAVLIFQKIKEKRQEKQYCEVIDGYAYKTITITETITKQLNNIIVPTMIQQIIKKMEINIEDLIRTSITNKYKTISSVFESYIDESIESERKELAIYDSYLTIQKFNAYNYTKQKNESIYNINVLYYSIDEYLLKQKIVVLIKEYLKKLNISYTDVYYNDSDKECFISLKPKQKIYCIGKWNSNSITLIKIPYIMPVIYIGEKIRAWIQEDYFDSFNFKYLTYSEDDLCDLKKENLLTPIPLTEINQRYFAIAEDCVKIIENNLGV